MKLHADTRQGHHAIITACGPGYVSINGQRHEHSLVLRPTSFDAHWPVPRIEDLTADHVRALAEHPSDVVLLGTGQRQRFPAPAVLAPLMAAHIGVEVMDTAAACRTYNILMAEGRVVTAALIVE